ncbi:MAG: SBBP repeat-containing protein [Chitinophagaceae bacterium]
MKELFIILFLIPVVFLLHGQNVNFQWAKQMGGVDMADARGVSIVTDAAGNIYTTGIFRGRVDFDPGQRVYNLDAMGTEDSYISKLDQAGKLLWVRQMDIIGSAISATAKAITIDPEANIFITGNFFEEYGRGQCFICKLDSAGNLLWTRKLSVSSGGTAIRTDVVGNVYIAGSSLGQVDFDPGPGVFNLGDPAYFSNFFFVSKLDKNGNFVWAKKIGGEGNALGGDVSITTDGDANVYMTGTFWGVQDFDPGPLLYNMTPAGSVGAHDMFVLKLNTDGNFAWAKQMGGDDEDIGISIATDAFGNIYTAGNFTGTADFDPGPGVFNLITRNGISNVCIAKLGKDGNFIWAKQLTGGNQWCYSTTLDNNGGLYITGYFGNTSDFDPGPGVYNLSTPRYDVFICKLNPDGNFVWAKQIGGTATVITNSIVVDVLGNVITTGYFFRGQADFDPGTGSFPLMTGEGENIFVHKMSQCLGNTSSAISASACKNYTLNGQTYNTSGVYTQTLAGAAGCDSIITLTLAINPVRNVITIAACNNFALNDHIYSNSGVYTDTLKTLNGCDSIITLQLTITPPLFTSITRTICEGQSFGGHTSNGIYTDTLVTANGCDSIVTLYLAVLPPPSPYLGADTLLCPGDSLLLYPGKFTTYTWQDGSATDHITIKKPGLYSVRVTDNCGSGADQVIINEGICGIYFPKAFTPNNDGINDLFKILRPANLTEYHLSVYNRWGQKVFETFDYSKGWNGSFNGQLQTVQTFVWFCEFKKQGNENKTKTKGMVTLVR